MRYCIIIPDGAADLPVAALEGRTPLYVARTPNLDRASQEGLLGLSLTVPARMTPGSDVAIMSVMGYDPAHCYTGRGPLEAADMGVELAPEDLVFRCNLITTDGERLVDFCSGHIGTAEADVLIQALNAKLGGPDIRFHTGTGYRHLMVLSGAGALSLRTIPPHDVVGEKLVETLPRGKGSDRLIDLMRASMEVLADHEVNKVRRDLQQNPANMIWLWGQGVSPKFEPFQEKYGRKGSAISAVNLMRGIAKLVGWDIIQVPGITGYTDTDYGAKGRYAIDALSSHELVLTHVEAPDEASHEGDVRAKIRAIEQVDREIVGPLMAEASQSGDIRMLALPDHLTSVESGKHVRGLVPFVIWGAGVRARSGLRFNEAAAAETEIVEDQGHRLMSAFLSA